MSVCPNMKPVKHLYWETNILKCQTKLHKSSFCLNRGYGYSKVPQDCDLRSTGFSEELKKNINELLLLKLDTSHSGYTHSWTPLSNTLLLQLIQVRSCWWAKLQNIKLKHKSCSILKANICLKIYWNSIISTCHVSILALTGPLLNQKWLCWIFGVVLRILCITAVFFF